MSGPFGSSQWMYSSGAAGFYGTEIDGSLRLTTSDWLNRNPGSSGDQNTWTVSFWFKRGLVSGSRRTLFSAGAANTLEGLVACFIDENYRLDLAVYNSGGQEGRIISNAKLRDPSAWYHFVLVVDAGNGTANDRMRMYINGERVTSLATNDTIGNQSWVGRWNRSGGNMLINRYAYSNNLPEHGYYADFYNIDGQALTPSSFGETKSGVWIPKAYSGSYGTNGFHLEFAGNTNDSAGSNNWTANSVSSYDYVADSPTNNFAVLNPEGTNDISSFSQGNLQITTGSGASSSGATMGMSSGKWYAEFVCTAKSSVNFGIGITKATTFDGDNQLDEGTNVGYFWVNNATINHGFANDSYGSTWGVGDVMGVAFDADTLALQFYINGVGQGNYTRVASEHTAGDHWIFGCGEGQGGATATFRANFGQDSTFQGYTASGGNSDDNGYGDFKYAPPSGYLALCTANLPDPVIDPAQGASPADHFDIDIYTGTGATHERSNFNFQPDMLWGKSRSNAYNHLLMDSIRGTDKGLFPDVTNAEATNTLWLTSFDNDGFTLGPLANWNGSGSTYVMWGWKANGSGVSNTDGSITSTVSANTTSGFSVGTFVGNQTAGATVGHGLSQAPEMIIIKDRPTVNDWPVYHASISPSQTMKLNSTNAAFTESTIWNNTAPTASVFTLGSSNLANNNTKSHVFYAFHSVEGFSSFGSYVGNGSSDGPFVYCGFRPAFVLTKPADTASSWCIHDSERTPANTGTMGYFKANTSDAENFSRFDMDLLSNGFKIKSSDADVNHSGGRVIYMAFAENPFKYANAR